MLEVYQKALGTPQPTGCCVPTVSLRLVSERVDGELTSYPPTLKAKIAVEAIRAQKTIIELAQLYHINPNLVAKWKKQANPGVDLLSA